MGLASIKFLENIELAREYERNNRGAYEGRLPARGSNWSYLDHVEAVVEEKCGEVAGSEKYRSLYRCRCDFWCPTDQQT
jgi:hypothetical protein